MSEIALVGPSLEDLAERINAEYQAMRTDAVSFLWHAVRCGEALLQVRAQIGLKTGHDDDGWTVWLQTNTEMAFSFASQLMRLAYYQDKLPQEAFQPYVDARGSRQQPTISRAFRYLHGLTLPPLSDSNRYRRIPEETRLEAKRLHSQGVDKKDIASLLGISVGSVYNICVPGRKKRVEATARKKRQEAARARRLLAEKQLHEARRAAAQEHGGAIEESYSLVRRLAQRLQESRDAETDPSVRRHLEEAIAQAHGAEDKIGLALRVPRRSVHGTQRLPGEGR